MSQDNFWTRVIKLRKELAEVPTSNHELIGYNYLSRPDITQSCIETIYAISPPEAPVMIWWNEKISAIQENQAQVIVKYLHGHNVDEGAKMLCLASLEVRSRVHELLTKPKASKNRKLR